MTPVIIASPAGRTMDQSEGNFQNPEYFRQEFSRLIARPEEDLDLGRAALLMAGEEYPELDVDGHLRILDHYASAVRDQVPANASPAGRAEALGRYLFGELGFQGNSDDYYNPDNSYFNRVLETQTGIPITLSLLFVEVGRRIGLRCRGVGMPGHFLVGLEGEDVYVDPFNGGETLDSSGCRQLAERLFGQRLTWDDSFLTPCTKYEFLFRILNNLKVVYEQSEAPEKALGVVQRMLMVRPEMTALYKEQAGLQFNLKQYRAAIRSLEGYLRDSGDAADAPQVKTWIDSIRATLSRLN